VTRVPQLEQELLAAATRLRGPRRIGARALRAALAAGAVALVVAVVVSAGDGGGGRQQAPGAPGFPPSAGLEDMLGVFRTPATPADDNGFSKDDLSEIPDRQPGEDPTRSRRVEWPGATVFLWPMRDGVCYGVGGGGGCVPLDYLRRMGVAVGTHSSGRQASVSGVVVDGIREVVVTASGGRNLHVAVSENFFFVDLNRAARKLRSPGWEARVRRVSWRYAGRERSFDIGRLLRHTVPPAPSPPDGATAAPKPDVEPLAGSLSERLELTAAGISYTAVGFRTRGSSLCAALTEADEGAPPARAA
jgi:hypothetical protein